MRSGSEEAADALPDLESVSHVGPRAEPEAAQRGLLADAAHHGLWHDGPRAVEEFALDAVTFRFGLDLSLVMVYKPLRSSSSITYTSAFTRGLFA